jgi:hypothetical protein
LDTIFTFYFPPSSSELSSFSRRSAKTRGRAANNAEHTSAAEYAVMSTDGEYNFFARKRPKYNVLEKKNFSDVDWY